MLTLSAEEKYVYLGVCDSSECYEIKVCKKGKPLIIKQNEKKRRTSSRKNLVRNCIVMLAVLAAGILLGGCSVVERVSYEWLSPGVEKWETAAVEAGVVSSVEEYYYQHFP